MGVHIQVHHISSKVGTAVFPVIPSHFPSQVYRVLALSLLICAVGVWLNAQAPWTAGLGAIGALISTPWLLLTPTRADTRPRRRQLLGAVALSQGMVIGPLVNASLAIAPVIVLAAVLATATVRGWSRCQLAHAVSVLA